MVVQHNMMGLNAYNRLGGNVTMMQKNLEKLSSGFKINRAADDAAGLAISEKMRAQITGLNRSVQNAKDGISFVQTAEGALQEVHTMLNRLTDLAVQSSNGIYTTNERQKLQDEVDEIIDEVNRISKSTNFNGIQMLDGSMASRTMTTNVADKFDANNTNGNGGTTVPTDAALDGTHGLIVVQDADQGRAAADGIYEYDFSQLIATAGTPATIKVSLGGDEIKMPVAGGGGGNSVTANVGTQTGRQVASNLAALINEQNAAGIAFNSGAGNITWSDVTAEADGATLRVTVKSKNVDFKGKLSIDIDGQTTTKVGVNGGDSQGVKVVQEYSKFAPKSYAQAKMHFDALNVKADGAAVQIGDTTYTFAIGKGSVFTNLDNVVDMTDFRTADVETETFKNAAAARLTQAAANNKQLQVTTSVNTFRPRDEKAPIIYFTERDGGINYEEHDLIGTPMVYTANGDIDNGKQSNHDGNWKGLVKTGTASYEQSSAGLKLQIGDTGDRWNQLRVSIEDMSARGIGIDGLDIMTVDKANDAVDKIKTAIDNVSRTRSRLGATQNRLEYTINSLNTTAENLTASESRIRDTDMAQEMMKFTKNQVLVQSAQAMLAQANQVPGMALQLLR